MGKPTFSFGNDDDGNNGGVDNSNSEPGRGTDNGAASGTGNDAGSDAGTSQQDGAHSAQTTAEPPQKRRGGWPKGKPRGSRASADANPNASASAASKSARMDREKVGVLAQQIGAFHQFAAMATGIPELMLDENEAGLLARSINDLSQHYGPIISGPGMLWVSFAGIAAMIYVPRASVVASRFAAMKRAKRAQQQTGESTVIHADFTPQPRQQTQGDPFAPGSIG